MDKRINEINAPLMLVFPDCAALASSAPVSVAEMQTLIEPAEALSGLARAFFYASARALLVSHCKVGSERRREAHNAHLRRAQARPWA